MPAVAVPPIFETGVSDTTELNLLSAAVQFLLSPPRAELRQTSSQTFTTAVAAATQFNAEDIDDDVDHIGGHDNAVNNTRYTARYAGWYLISGAAEFALNATGDRFVWLTVNGGDVNGSVGFLPADATALIPVPVRTKTVYLNAGDYVELIAMQSSGGNLGTSVTTRDQSSMSVQWVSSA